MFRNKPFGGKTDFSALVAQADGARDRGAWEEATALYRQALALNPDNFGITVQLGHALKEAGSLKDAEATYEAAMRLNTTDADIFLQMGHLQKLLGDQKRAGEFYRQSLRLRPDLPDARRELAALGVHLPMRPSDPKRTSTALVIDISDLVFYIGHHDNLTGIQRVQSSVIQSLVAMKDNEFEIIFVSYDRQADDFFQVDPAIFHDCLIDLSNPIGNRSIFIDKERARRGEFFPLGRFEPDAVSDQSVFLLLGAAWVIPDYAARIAEIKRIGGLRFVMTFHDFIPIFARETCDQGTAEVFQYFIDHILSLVDNALCVSQNTAADLVRYCNNSALEAPPFTVTRNGSSFTASGADAGPLPALSKEEEPYVLFVSTIEGRKNHEYMLRIWSLLKSRGIKVPRLICVGRLGWRSERFLQDLLSRNYLDGTIEIRQDVSDIDLAELYRGCLFTVYPSKYEGWGLPVGESLSFGKICICSDSSSLPEVAGRFGIYIPLEDVESAARIVREWITDHEKRGELERDIIANYKPVSWDDVAVAVLAGCRTARNGPARGAHLHARIGSEFTFRRTPTSTGGALGAQMIDLIVNSFSNVILDGFGAMPERIAALSARDGNWFEPEQWGCWSRGLSGGLWLSFQEGALDNIDVVHFYASLQGPAALLPASVSLKIGNVRLPQTMGLEASLRLFCWKLPARELRSQLRARRGGEPLSIKITFSLETGAPDPWHRLREFDSRSLGIGLCSLAILDANDLSGRISILERLSFLSSGPHN